MNIVEFVEKIFEIKLLDYQKAILKDLENAPRDARLVIGPNGSIVGLPIKKGKRDDLER